MEKILEELSEVEVSDLERKGKDFSFSDVQELNVLIFEKIKILRENPDFIQELPENKRNHIENLLERFLLYVQVILSFDPYEETPQDTRDAIARKINDLYEELYGNLFPHLDAFLSRKTDPMMEELLKKAKEDVSEIENKNQKVEKTLEEADKTLESLRIVSAEIGVSKFASVFDKEAKQNKKTAYIWLFVSIVSAIGIVFFLHSIFNQLISVLGKSNIEFELSLQIFLTKLLIFSFLSVVFIKW